MLNFIKIVLLILINILVGMLLSPIYIVFKITGKLDYKQIQKLYKLWLN